MKKIRKTNLFLFSLILISMLFSALPSFADIAPPPLSYIDVFINQKGRIIFPSPKQIKAYAPKHYDRFGDSELQQLQVGEYVGFSDKKGKVVIKPQFDMVQSFSEGLAAVRKNNKWGYINEKGDWVIPPKYPSIMCYQYNSSGNYFHFYKCNSSSNFHDGLAPVSYAEEIKVRYGHGLAVTYLEPVFPKGQKSMRGQVGGYIKDQKFYIINNFGDVTDSGYIITQYKNGYIDKTGNVVIKGDFDEPQPFSEGLAVARGKYGQYGYIDKTGKFVIKPQFDYANSFSSGIARVRIPAYVIIFKFSVVLLVLLIITGISIRRDKNKEIDDKPKQD